MELLLDTDATINLRSLGWTSFEEDFPPLLAGVRERFAVEIDAYRPAP